MKNKNKIIIAGLVIFCIVILVISLIVFNKEDKNDNTNDKNSEYKEIKIENQNKLYDTSEVSMDLNSDGTKENIKIIEGTASIEINNTKYLDNAKEGYSYQYLIIDLNFDGNLEIIQREMRVTVSPISSSYRVYSYKNIYLILYILMEIL